jgi:hypothetical protein
MYCRKEGEEVDSRSSLCRESTAIGPGKVEIDAEEEDEDKEEDMLDMQS